MLLSDATRRKQPSQARRRKKKTGPWLDLLFFLRMAWLGFFLRLAWPGSAWLGSVVPGLAYLGLLLSEATRRKQPSQARRRKKKTGPWLDLLFFLRMAWLGFFLRLAWPGSAWLGSVVPGLAYLGLLLSEATRRKQPSQARRRKKKRARGSTFFFSCVWLGSVSFFVWLGLARLGSARSCLAWLAFERSHANKAAEPRQTKNKTTGPWLDVFFFLRMAWLGFFLRLACLGSASLRLGLAGRGLAWLAFVFLCIWLGSFLLCSASAFAWFSSSRLARRGFWLAFFFAFRFA